jgi:WD40 repeat protein
MTPIFRSIAVLIVGLFAGGQTAAADKIPENFNMEIVRKFARESVFGLAWSPDGRYLAAESGGGEGYVVWDVQTGKNIRELKSPYGPWAGTGDLSFTPDGKHLIVLPHEAVFNDGGQRVAFALWNIQTGEIDRKIVLPDVDGGVSHRKLAHYGISSAALRMAVVYGGEGGSRKIHIYDTQTWDVINTAIDIRRSMPPRAFAFSGNGHLVAIGDMVPEAYDGTPQGMIWIYRVEDGRLIKTIERAHANIVAHLAFAQNEKLLVSAASQYGKQLNPLTGLLDTFRDGDPVRIWDILTGAKVASLNAETGAATSLAVNSDGTLVAFGGATKINGAPGLYHIWNPGNTGPPLVIDGMREGTYAAAFHPNRQAVAIHGRRGIWSAEVLVLQLKSK